MFFFFAKALALDCLPQGKTTAEAFGLWGVAGGKRPSRWWFQIFFYFHPYWGKISNLTNVFQMGLKPPTSHVFWSGYHGKCEKKQQRPWISGRRHHKVLVAGFLVVFFVNLGIIPHTVPCSGKGRVFFRSFCVGLNM